MRRPSIVSQAVRATVLVALLSSLSLAATTSLVARVVWRSQEQQRLRESTSAFARSLALEASEDNISLAQAAPGTMRESAPAGYQVEIWQDGKVLAAGPAETRLGPLPRNGPLQRKGWLLQTEALPGSLIVILGFPQEQGLRAWRIFSWSFLLSSPLCVLLAIVAGWFAGQRTTRPLVDFRERVLRTSPEDSLPASRARTVPAEIHDLEQSFRGLLARLQQTLCREREFAANAAHELRTPLTMMRLEAERARADAGDEGRRQLDEQLAEIDRTVRLVDSLLVLAQDTESGIPGGDVVNLADLARDVAGRVLTNGLQHATAGLPDEALTLGDENLLSIALENLVENARKFTTDEGRVRMRLVEEAGRVVLRIVSPGPRISPAARERLFDRFYRDPEARAALPGHGLGLPLSRHIARLHGGDVTCVSGPDEDPCFALELPAWEPHASSPTPTSHARGVTSPTRA